MKKVLATLAFVACAGTANAGVIYSDDFSNVSPAPTAGNWLPLTGGFNSEHHYTIGSTDIPSSNGNFDVVDKDHVAGICAPGKARCVDLDGTDAGHNSYLYTDGIAVTPNTTYAMTVLVGGNKRNAADDNFIFGFMNAASNDAIDNAFLTVKDFGWQEDFQALTVSYTTGASENLLKLFVQNWTSDPAHPERTLYQGMPEPDKFGPMLQTLTLTAVPLPAAAWLLLSGLAGVGVFGRRKRGAPAAA